MILWLQIYMILLNRTNNCQCFLQPVKEVLKRQAKGRAQLAAVTALQEVVLD